MSYRENSFKEPTMKTKIRFEPNEELSQYFWKCVALAAVAVFGTNFILTIMDITHIPWKWFVFAAGGISASLLIIVFIHISLNSFWYLIKAIRTSIKIDKVPEENN